MPSSAGLSCLLLALLSATSSALRKSSPELTNEFANVGEVFMCEFPREDLQTSKSFNPTWWQNSSLSMQRVRTEHEGCDRFHGRRYKCGLDVSEHYLVRKWIPEGAVVLEFGARFGTTTCEIAKKIGDSGEVIAVEPDARVWLDLEQNLIENNCHARVIKGTVSKRRQTVGGGSYRTRTGCDKGVKPASYFYLEVQKALGKPVDTMLFDCESCVFGMMDQISTALANDVRTVILKQDAHPKEHEAFFATLVEYGFRLVDRINDCDRALVHKKEDAWCGKSIYHLVFQKQQ